MMRSRRSGAHPRRAGAGPLQALLLVPALVLMAGCEPEPGPADGTGEADLVLLNGRVVTVDRDHPEAEALAIQGDRILAVGTNQEIEALSGPETEVVELGGRLVIPGFVEGHGHFLGLGRARMILDLTGVTTWEELVDLVGEAAAEAEPGAWIVGRGWHQERWDPPPADAIEGVPPHAALSQVTPDHPVHLTHASGHASIANGLALELAGIDAGTPDPAGGEIVKDADGNPTGLLRETAQRLVSQAQAEREGERTDEERETEFRRQVELAGEEALRLGVTSFHDAGTSFDDIDRLRGLADEGALPIRLYVMVRRATNQEMAERLPEYRMEGYGNHFLTVRSIKRQIDGALGPHGAWLLDPYEDLPESRGLTLEEPDDIRGTAELAVQHDYQLNTHAIGDRANREVLDIYEEVLREAGRLDGDHRWRIEHAQHLHPDDIARFGELGVIASMQGIHGTSDGPWVLARLGEDRAREGAYMWRDLMDSGALICNGTDAPVEPLSPIESWYASVSRKMQTGDRFFPDQAMTRLEALESYTINCAHAAFQEDLLGSITPGKLADLVVLDRDIMTIPEDEIPGTEVDITILGGEVRFRK